jgi:hypothetical protein
MAQGRSTKIILMIKRIRTSWLSIKNSLWLQLLADAVAGEALEDGEGRHLAHHPLNFRQRLRCAVFFFSFIKPTPLTK